MPDCSQRSTPSGCLRGPEGACSASLRNLTTESLDCTFCKESAPRTHGHLSIALSRLVWGSADMMASRLVGRQDTSPPGLLMFGALGAMTSSLPCLSQPRLASFIPQVRTPSSYSDHQHPSLLLTRILQLHTTIAPHTAGVSRPLAVERSNFGSTTQWLQWLAGLAPLTSLTLPVHQGQHCALRSGRCTSTRRISIQGTFPASTLTEMPTPPPKGWTAPFPWSVFP